MAVEVISRPLGHKLSTTDLEAQVIDSGTGEALVYTGTAHGLSDGDYIYIDSNFDSLNGFKYVDSIAYDSFKLKDSEGGDYVAYKQDADISYRVSVLDHGWQCVHLPIVYELATDLQPNTTDPGRVVSFVSDENGYTGLAASIDFVDIDTFDYIELVGDGELAGVYQVLDYIDPDEVIINLRYDAGHSFAGYSIRKYYYNYYITVNVYAGFPVGHRWESEKPYELAVTLKYLPDANGHIKFSIAEELKGYITTRNNLTLDTLPNNTDFWTSFYITYSETYDVSDGTTVTSEEQEITTDSFEGYAVNAILPFKSLNQGHMSSYLSEGALTSRWLTTQERPVAYVDRFFDISFINQYPETDITIFKNGVSFITLSNVGLGIIRVPVTIESGESEVCLQAVILFGGLLDLSTFTLQTGSGSTWNLGSLPNVDENSKKLYKAISLIAGNIYTVTLNETVLGGIHNGFIIVGFLDSGLSVDVSESEPVTGLGPFTKVFSLTATADSQYLFVQVTASGLASVQVNSIHIDSDETYITEQICIDVVDACSTFTSDDLRLTEGGSLREIE